MAQYRQKIFSDSKYAEKELGRIVIILNQQVESIQSEILGRLYSSYIKGAITWGKFWEFAEANRRMFAEDYMLLDKLSNGKKTVNKLGKQDKYRVGRLIGLGMVVEKDSPAADKSFMEQFMNDHLSDVRGKKVNSLIVMEDDYELTSFGKGFL